MAKKIVSPGVFTNEIDQSFLPAAVGEIGAALIGPTVKGPALVPTVVTSFSEYERMFGTSFKSGSSYYQYLTSHTAEQYLKHSGQLTVVRVLAGTYSHATANVSSSVDPAVVGKSTGTAPHTGSITLVGPNLAVGTQVSASLKPFGGSSVVFKITGSSAPRTNTSTLIHVNSGSSLAATATLFAATVNNSQSLHGLFITASAEGSTVGLTSSLFPNTSGAEHGTHGAFGIPNSAGPNFHGSPSVIHGGSSPLYNAKGVYVDIEKV